MPVDGGRGENSTRASLIRVLASDKHFAYNVCPNGHYWQTCIAEQPMYPCRACGCSMQRATRWLAEREASGAWQ